jgi:sugar/nucleoside kinase (ribokinase family)
MGEAKFDVVGIGNAIVDIIAHCDDAFLAKHDAPKGHMRLVDAEQIAALYDAIGPAVEISGGSAANTIAGVASLGGSAAYIGKVADDEFGRIFAHDIKAIGVSYDTPPAAGGAPTARSLVLVTPDGERTMSTFLGISPELGAAELDEEKIVAGKILYLEGYLFDADEAKASFRRAAQMAKDAGRQVSLTLSDGFCVDRHRDEFLDFIRSDVDILFANESEITSLYQISNFEDAIGLVKKDTALAALTRSEKGSVIVIKEEEVAVPAHTVAKVVDTTGAGDLYASGFLFGHARGMDFGTCARLGSLAAGEVISHLGARPETDLAGLAKKEGLL